MKGGEEKETGLRKESLRADTLDSRIRTRVHK